MNFPRLDIVARNPEHRNLDETLIRFFAALEADVEVVAIVPRMLAYFSNCPERYEVTEYTIITRLLTEYTIITRLKEKP